ncbi:hypothetical protein KUTeg_020159 [Tegillarca granosa]|uniref:EXPERA domain-containing protein n=1 Tax=Tegillarca granosa TaxID=220873 RepID=A0ABQ9EBA9_TEGGR|nr:hypothetical protein KUTeg_020159 [Tegillarca granosa]
MAHPYYPKTLSIPNYVANEGSVTELLGIFFSIVLLILGAFWFYTGRRCSFLMATRVKLCWFFVCGFIHIILEGYFSLYHRSLVEKMTYLAQMWKEYGKGDSRYVTSDTCIVIIESITAVVDGPLCFLTVFSFLSGNSYRYILQLIVSTCQLYGDTMYFLTEFKEDFIHSEFGHPLHFWFYMVILNSFWIIIPLIMIIDSCVNLSQSQDKCDKMIDKKEKTNKGKKKNKTF